MTNVSDETVDRAKAGLILHDLFSLTAGPREAYSVLVLAIYCLNFELSESPIGIDELAEEVSASLRSIKGFKTQ